MIFKFFCVQLKYMVFKKIREHQAYLKKEVMEKTVGYILAALGLVAGLAWNEAIKSFIDQFFPATSHSVLIKFVYAIIVTVIIVIVTLYLVKLLEKKEPQV